METSLPGQGKCRLTRGWRLSFGVMHRTTCSVGHGQEFLLTWTPHQTRLRLPEPPSPGLFLAAKTLAANKHACHIAVSPPSLDWSLIGVFSDMPSRAEACLYSVAMPLISNHCVFGGLLSLCGRRIMVAVMQGPLKNTCKALQVTPASWKATAMLSTPVGPSRQLTRSFCQLLGNWQPRYHRLGQEHESLPAFWDQWVPVSDRASF